ncbi:MAG: haloacid dehalogenase type II [Silicimonas sp.]|nr:haloacid dehalogenase type II [Silicimonas sp.]
MERAFIFDVFGTCVDWRESVAAAVRVALPEVDPHDFADAWRAEYDPAMARIRAGDRGYVPLEVLHLENLDRVAARLGVSVSDRDGLNAVWTQLAPWPDVVPGLLALRAHGLIAPCSNGSIAMMTRLARFGGLPWDTVVGADLARDYKPRPEVYLASARAFGLAPGAVTMVAAHNGDLEAARDAGLGTAFVPRLTEHGPGQATDLAPSADWDIVAEDFTDLARKAAP